ncbi:MULTISPECIES: TPR end-of-group domain-containing protein [unclassified Caballeronia]|uniref:TPR end-of-group domain-containing protein n=1 Tax=unclassified Caballeronia TaxID=2646786 RepID=UPI0020295226|nr:MULTISPECIES: hypothetical protein [unclassified Caballeronia]MDR5770103.1 hypothetical protein [Caballeronia sp. LZ028]
MATYKCPALGECELGMTGELIERAPGEDLRCPKCATLLELQVQKGTGGKKLKPQVIAAVVGAAVLVIGGGSFAYMHSHKPTESAEQASATSASSVAVSEAAPAASTPAPAPTVANAGAASSVGIAPTAEDIAKDRQAGDKQLTGGDAAGAETASNRAAAKEMIKVAIADMAQGKLDDAEKELTDAQVRDPKQSLVYYNLGVLRLKQSRTDDALKAFEASFLNGFGYFDAMAKDPDLDAIRHDPRFEALLKKYRPESA